MGDDCVVSLTIMVHETRSLCPTTETAITHLYFKIRLKGGVCRISVDLFVNITEMRHDLGYMFH